MTIAKVFRLLLGLSCAIFFIWLIISQIELDSLINALQNTDLNWILAALAAFCCGYICRIARWYKMLVQDNQQLTFINCAGPLLASFAVNNVLPFRTGDIMRAFAFKRQLGTSSGIVVASLFVERLLDLLMVLLLLGSALAIFNLDFEHYTGLASVLLISLALMIILMLLVPRLFTPLTLIFNRIVLKLAPIYGRKISDEINKAMNSFIHLSTHRTMLILVFWSILAWLAEGCVFWCVAMAFQPTLVVPEAAWLALPVGTLATLIPSTPGYVGTFDYFTIKAMTTLGNTQTISTAYTLLVHALLWIPPTLIGGLYLLTFNRHPQRRHTL